MCRQGKTVPVLVQREYNCSTSNWHAVPVDRCIAPLVQELNNRGIVTLGSCCGHGIFNGDIVIAAESEPLLKHYGYEYEIDPEYGDIHIFSEPLKGWYWTLCYWWFLLRHARFGFVIVETE